MLHRQVPYGIEKEIGLDLATKNLNLNSTDRPTLNAFIDDYFPMRSNVLN
jgi:hypothetical protein